MEFHYQAKSPAGEFFEGTLEAPSENQAVELLHSKGFVVLSLKENKKALFSADLNQLFARPNTKDIVIFTRQLATLIDADMPLAEGLRTLAKQVEKPAFAKIVSEISDLVEGGSSLSNALDQYPKLFTQFYVKLVKSGEASGKLHEALSYLADYLERSQAINSKIVGALIYPGVVVTMMILVFVLMVTMVLPKLLLIFKESNVQEIPFVTRMMIALTDFVNGNIIIIGITFLLIAGGIAYYVRTPKGKVALDNIRVTMPVMGKILRNLYIARMSESLSTLIKAEISILDALKITSDLVGNITFQDTLLEAEESVRGGGTISEIFTKSPFMPPLLTSMIAIGERTGKIDFMLGHVSKFYKEEAENSVENMTRLLEPLIILVLGVGVVILVIGILLPIFNFATSV
jgi:type IV pilus assembly protein PilC